MKKAMRILLSAALALSMVFAAVGCKTEVIEEVYPDPAWHEVTVINGTVKGAGYNHDRVKEGGSITVVATQPKATAEDTFEGWYVGGNKVSSDTEYTFTPTADTTVTAQYGLTWDVWDGIYPDSKPAGYVEEGDWNERKGGTIHIKSAAALAYWNKQFNAKKSDGDSTARGHYAVLDGPVFQTTAGTNAQRYAASAHEENVWTFSLECNVDLSAGDWDPISDFAFDFEGTTFDGNYHIIKGMKATPTSVGETKDTYKLYGGGFFGHIAGSSFTIKNVTFDSATVLSNGNKNFDDQVAGNQDMAIVIGYAHANNRYSWFNDIPQLDVHQKIVMDNVNITNALITGPSEPCKAGFYVGRLGVSWEANKEPEHLVIKNCTVSDSTIAVWRYAGAMVGYMYASDWDINIRNTDIYDIYDNTITNVNLITGVKAKADSTFKVGASDRDALGWTHFFYEAIHVPFAFEAVQNLDLTLHDDKSAGTMGIWDCGYFVFTPVDLDTKTNKVENVNVINLRLAASTTFATDWSVFRDAVDDNKDEIFVVTDITKTGEFDGEGPSATQVFYFVGDAKLNGCDVTIARYISGAKDGDGNYIVTDANGTQIGVWKVSADGTATGVYEAKAA